MKSLFIKAKPNTLATFEWLMNEGHKFVERKEAKNFEVCINFKNDSVSLYLIK